MKHKICVVTGANSGIGFEATRSLASLGAKVVLVCRDRGKGEVAIGQIRDSHPSADLRLEVMDLANLEQIRELGYALSEDFPTLDLLVNNAGVYRSDFEVTADGFERTMAVNHLSHFLLTHLLLAPLLAKAGRVINVSSEAHRRGRLDPESLQETLRGPDRYNGWQAYSDSKLTNVLFSAELARRYRAEKLAVCSVHPGVLSTRIWNQNRNPMSILMNLFKPFMGKPSVGGDAVVFLSQEPVASIHGKYFDKKRAVDPAPLARDLDLARLLWDLSAEAVGLPPESLSST